MPLSMVVEGELRADAEFGAGTGRALYAWVLERMARVDAAAARVLHDHSEVKPLTVSGLQGPLAGSGVGRVRAAHGARLWARYTALAPGMEDLLGAALRGCVGEDLRVRDVSLYGLAVHTESAAHPWAARASYQDLFDAALGAPAPETLTIRFQSPTTFRARQGNLPLPLPALVFRTLLEKWNRFSPVRLGPFGEAIEDGVRLQAYQCQTRRMHLGGHGEVGFTGSATFDLRGLADPMLQRVVGALGAYALYSGIGAKTTMGLGQARVLEAGDGRG